MLVAKCNLVGWDLSRETLAKIESQIRWVSDAELVCFAVVLNVEVTVLLPPQKSLRRTALSFVTAKGRPSRDS